MVNRCLFANGKTSPEIADETILTVRADGKVVWVHQGVDIKFGRLTKPQLAALSPWYRQVATRK